MTDRLRDKATELRDAFDASFGAPLQQTSQSGEDFLAVRVCGHAYAIRLRDIAGIVGKHTIVHVPASAAGLLGLTGVRGQIVPVFSMGSLLGHSEHAEAPRWFVLCGSQDPVALAFAELEGYLRLVRETANADTQGAVVVTETQTRPVVDIPRIMTTLRERAGNDRSKKEE